MIGSILAFCMEFSEFLLLTYTSSLTLSIAGIFKEVFTLYLAVNYNGDQMSLLNFFGLIVCLTGIGLHVTIKALDTSGKNGDRHLCLTNQLRSRPKAKHNHVDKDTKSNDVESKRLLDGIEEDVLFDLKPIGTKLS